MRSLPAIEIVTSARMSHVDLITAQIHLAPDRIVIVVAMRCLDGIRDPGSNPERREYEDSRDQQRRSLRILRKQRKVPSGKTDQHPGPVQTAAAVTERGDFDTRIKAEQGAVVAVENRLNFGGFFRQGTGVAGGAAGAVDIKAEQGPVPVLSDPAHQILGLFTGRFDHLAGIAQHEQDFVTAFQVRLEEARNELDESRKRLADARDELAALCQRQTAASERAAMLEELQRRQEGLGAGVKEVWKVPEGRIAPGRVMLQGTPEDVRRDVRIAMDTAKRGGGFILGPSHSVAYGTSYDNFMAMLDEFERTRDY